MEKAKTASGGRWPSSPDERTRISTAPSCRRASCQEAASRVAHEYVMTRADAHGGGVKAGFWAGGRCTRSLSVAEPYFDENFDSILARFSNYFQQPELL